VAGIVGIAAAPDFTEELVWKQLNPVQQMEMREKGVIYEPTEYDIEPVPYTWRLVEEGRSHLMLNAPIDIRCPARLIQGMQDKDVPWEWALRTGERLASSDVRITLMKEGDHRLSRPEDLELLWREIESIPS
jgi:pimeloyl-ACP methyl ester carboxylesterase